MPVRLLERDARVAAEQSLRCVRRLLRAGADTRLRRADGALPVHAVLLVGDLRVADAIFEAEERRGTAVDASQMDRKERTLRAAVAVYRRTGDASLPASLRERLCTFDLPWSGAQLKDVQVIDSTTHAEPAVSIRTLPTRDVPGVAATQAGVEAHVPRSADDANCCAAPGCGALGAALKMCLCRSAYYCRCAPPVVLL